MVNATSAAGTDYLIRSSASTQQHAHADFDVTAVAMGFVCVAEARIFADRFIANLSAVHGAPPTCLESLGLRTFLLAARDICDSVEQTCRGDLRIRKAGGRIRCPAFTRMLPMNRCERAASGISPGTKKFFAKTSFTQRLPPLSDRTIFGQVFVRGGMRKI